MTAGHGRRSGFQIACCITLVAAAMLCVPSTAFAQSAGDGAAANEISLAEAFFIQRNQRTGQIEWVGTGIVWLLLAMSTSTFALIGVLLRENRRSVIVPVQAVADVRRDLKDGGVQKLLKRVGNDDSYFCRVIVAALREADAGHEAMIRSLEQACEELTAMRFRRAEVLNIIGGVSPMIGLFGTVYGMILAFREIVAAGGSPDPVGLAAGIGTALTTTFWGLVVAIPALAGCAFIRNSIDALTSEAALKAEDIINHFRAPSDTDTEAA
jgi:biopolymer transport protein ExbB